MGGGGCPVCGMACTGHPTTAHRADYPLLPGGVDPLQSLQAGRDFVYATEAVVDHDLERVVYGAGDPVPMADAIRYGLVDAPDAAVPPPAPRKGRRKRRPQADRAIHGPVDTTAHTRSEDR